MQGKIIKGIGGFYYVYVEGAGLYECKAKGIFRNQKLKPMVGDNVEIADGPLAGFVGEVVEIDADAMKVKVNVSMFGRETLSELDLLQVKPI